MNVNGNYEFGYVKAVDLVHAGWALDGPANARYPLTITANTQANAAYDFLLQLVCWNSVDGSVTVLQESTQTTLGGIDTLAR